MRTWDVNSPEVARERPQILSTDDAARVIALDLPAGEAMQEHEVHEQALLIVLAGQVEVEAGGETTGGGVGFVAEWTAGERHEVRATEHARLLLVLAPWPGDGHPGAMTLEQKATARERAHERAQA